MKKMMKLSKQGLLIFFFLIRLGCIAKADYQEAITMSAIEQDALYTVMDSMAGGIDWKMLHPHPCSEDVWPGLVCEQGDDGLFHVTRLDFGYRPNPACMRNASVPAAIANLTHLRSLFIFECFSTFNTTIPISLVKLAPTLKELSLRTNSALVGTIPIELSNLSALQLLSLSQNGLSGRIPVQLSKLTALQHLDLSDNRLSGEVPHELGTLHNLIILDLSVNLINGPMPSSLGNLAMLQKLDLSFNSLRGTLPPKLGNLRRLQFLALNDNMLSGPYPAEMAGMVGLQYLILDNNPMRTTLPSFLNAYKGLMALSLSNSGYYGVIPDAYGELKNLTVLSLERNYLTGSIPSGLGKLFHIYQLNLSLNNLSGAIPFTQDFVQKLGRNLDLSGNTGLCSQWAMVQWVSKPTGGLPLCSSSSSSSSSSNPKISSLSTSFAAPMIRGKIITFSSSTICIVFTVILLQYFYD
ncbi:hypothetical protein GOP47_0019231 [Adiantum capillus-veneris]|uniref:Uncharacterized protein n=1 Tax=Adiantum capillus-veneris TaxID=13818 RepID=A0A9D4ZAB5_ADICA|nr:hypothetical protein GOP47_0019231 [Adiantum capillus-veneris]